MTDRHFDIPDADLLDDHPMADQSGAVFSKPELLSIGHVPESDRIVGREQEIEAVQDILKPAVVGNPPENGVIHGATGSGKSLVVRHVTGVATSLAQPNGIHVFPSYVDCDDASTQTQAARELAKQAAEYSSQEWRIPLKGYGANEYLNRLWNILEEAHVFIAVLDEVDKLDNDDLLRTLSRAQETGKTDCHISVVGISNTVDYTRTLGQRAKSSFQAEEVVFDSYDANQIEAILEKRRDAFKPGVLAEDVIPLTAALSAQDHGDARKAIEILRWTGKLALRGGHSKVSVDHVEEAQEMVKQSHIVDNIRGTPAHRQYVLEALARLDKSKANDAFPTSEIYDMYAQVVDRNGLDPQTEQSVLGHLKEWAHRDLTENKKTSGGKSGGVYREHRLMIEPEVVLEAVSKQDLI